ncbi:MAG: zinc dependent phospholipase C family protein, partial [Armatimonadota bacterium]
MRTTFRLSLLFFFAALTHMSAFAGQIPSHIYTGDNIRKANPNNMEYYIKAAPEAYLAGANGPDISNIMAILTKLSSNIGSESHYEKTGDLTIALLEGADTDEEKAFALGWMTHWINDYFIHALVNQWGGWYEEAPTRHKALEMLENKYVYSNTDIKKYNPETVPAAMSQKTYESVFEAFKKTYPTKSKYTTKGSRTDFLLWFRQANGFIRTASKSFMEAADNGTGTATDWITYEAFPLMPSSEQYKHIVEVAKITETKATKPTLTLKISLYDNKLHKWFLKEWNDAQTSATEYSVHACAAATAFLGAIGPGQREASLKELHAALPNVSIDQPRGDYNNSKIYPGDVATKEVYYECEITDNSAGGNKSSVVTGTRPIKLTMEGAVFGRTKGSGFDGADSGEIVLEIPTDSDSYKYKVKVSFFGKEPLADKDLKDLVWFEDSGIFGAEVEIVGDKTTKAATPLKLKATVTADAKTAPLVKLRWSDETNKKKLGDGETLSFVSNETGTFSIKAEAYTVENGKERILSDDTIDVEVTDPGVSVAIEGETSVEPGKALKLKANVTAEAAIKKALEIRWTDDTGKKSYGKGQTISFTQKTPGSYPIRAEAFWTPKPKVDPIRVGSDSKTITVGVSKVKLSVQGNTTATPAQSVALKAVLQGVQDSDKPTLRIVWTDATRKTSLGMGETVSFVTADPGSYEITVEVLQKSGTKEDVIANASHKIEVKKGADAISGVTLEATKTTLKPGEIADIVAKVDPNGITQPLKYQWTGEHGGSMADQGKVSFASRKNGPYMISVVVTDAKGKKGTASITLTVLGITATLKGCPSEIIYGQKAPLSVTVEGLGKMQEVSKPKDDPQKKPEEWVLTEILREDDKETWQEDRSLWWGT